MGATLSLLKFIAITVKDLSKTYSTVSKKIETSPGLPVSNPSRSYWMYPPSPIAQTGSNDTLPEYADIVIIGSGITGTAVAKTLLETSQSRTSAPLRVVMLEAREACSGATGRNGGHINAISYQDYEDLKKALGKEAAQKIILFRLSHLGNLIRIAEKENIITQSQCRKVDYMDVYMDRPYFEENKRKLATFCSDFRAEERESFQVIEEKAEIEKLQLTLEASGCIRTTGGVVHPYRFVTGIQSRLLNHYAGRFFLFTYTPCTDIQTGSSNDSSFYIVSTPRGTIKARHIVHATNGWTSNLLPYMRRKLVPLRCEMTAQRPGQGLGLSADDNAEWTGKRAFTFYRGSRSQFEFLTQQPSSPVNTIQNDNTVPPPKGELMFGGGLLQGGIGEQALFDAIGNADDSRTNFSVISFLTGSLSFYFGRSWGAEGAADSSTSEWNSGRCLASWCGVVGMSADEFPWVGRVPEKIADRETPKADVRFLKQGTKQSFSPHAGLAAPGEWISAGYTGEGMTNAWMSGTAVAQMILQTSQDVSLSKENIHFQRNSQKSSSNSSSLTPIPEWLPPQFLISEQRWRNVDIEDLLDTI